MEFYQNPPTPNTVDVEALSSFLEGPAPFDFSGSLLASYNGGIPTSHYQGTPPNFNAPHLLSSSPSYHPPVPPIQQSTFSNYTPSQQLQLQLQQELNNQPQFTASSSSNNSLTKRKRRRKDESALPDEVLKGFDWTFYQSPSPSFMVFDDKMRPITEQFDVTVYKCGTNTHYSSADQVWICYRQNQFKVFCLLKSPQPPSKMYVRDGVSTLEIAQFYVKLYAIKTPSNQGDEVQVGLVHVGKSRVKKEKTEITPVPFMDERAEFTNLQFERSNIAKGQPEYFHLVVGLYAKTANAYYLIQSKISPKILVRSQHPGFYGVHKNDTSSPTENRTPPSDSHTDTSQSQKSSTTNSEDGASPKPVDSESSNWQANGDALYHVGKVGINTSEPSEALTVHGNALITGDLYKPSDRRIKSDITPVSPSQQLDHIRELKIYDYKLGLQQKPERGVIAQELAVVMPNAVQEMGDVTIHGKNVPNLLVVNERVLLYENIGATQQLDKQLEQEKSNIIQMDHRMQSFAEHTNYKHNEMKGQIQSLTDLFFAEEISKGEMGVIGMKEEQVAFGLNLFRMGPARSIMVLGYFYPWLWAFGSVFYFSNIPSRKILGKANLVKFIAFASVYYFLTINSTIIIRLVYCCIGLSLLTGNYKRNCKRMEEEKKIAEMQALYGPNYIPPPPPPLPKWKARLHDWLSGWRHKRDDDSEERVPIMSMKAA